MRPRKVLRIARWEVARHLRRAGDRRAVVAAVLLVLATAGLGATVAPSTALDRGLYRVGVAPDHPYHGPATDAPAFAVRDPDPDAFEAGRLEILVDGERALYRDTEKGRAAIVAFRRAVGRYNDRRMAAEENQTAAFPVIVSLQYVERDGVREVVAPGESGGGAEGGDTTTGGSNGGSDGDGAGSEDTTGNDGDMTGSGIGGPLLGDILDGGADSGSPSDIEPPFPFESLVLAFLFVLPLNFVIQAYGSSMLGERINRRGELMLVAPVSRGEIVAGKTLPFVLASVGVASLVALAVGGGPLSVLAVVPLALLFLGATFVAAMFARSFKELTFLTVAVSVLLTTYTFVPAIFTDVTPVALISPLTVVVRDLTGSGLAPAGVAFATVPAALTALVLFALGTGLYREEDLFTQRPVHLKALDALAVHVRGPRSLAPVTALLIPFVFVAELLALALLFALPGRLSIVLLLVAVAVIEEVAKGLPAYAGFVHARYPRTPRVALAAGVFAGVGFFLAEKFTVVVQLVGLPEMPAGTAVFPGVAGGHAALALLLAPLALHVVTASLSAIGASRDAAWFGVGLSAAVTVHVTYNLTVVMALG